MLDQVPEKREEDPFRLFFASQEPPPLEDVKKHCMQELFRIARDTQTQKKEHTATRIALYIEPITLVTRQGFLNIKIPQGHRQLSKRKERRRQYAVTQQEYQRDRLRCIKNILDGITEARQLKKEVMEPYWTNVLTQNTEVAP